MDMIDVAVNLLPLIAGAALVPVWVIMIVLLLQRPDGLVVAGALIGGMTVVRLLQGIVFGYVIVGATAAGGDDKPGVIVSVVLLALGLLMWAAGLKQLLAGEDPDAPPPKWMAMIDRMSPLAAFGIGAGLLVIAAKQWVFMLGAIGVIQDARLGEAGSTVAYLLFILGAEALLLLPLLYVVVAREQATAVLSRFGDWLVTNNRVIVILVSVVFGSLFLWKGISGLMG
jgi:hypothetical protein